jgi:arylformamidase
MIINIYHEREKFQADLSKPIDISMPLKTGEDAARAWYVDPLKIEAVETEHFIGDVNRGGSVNFRNIFFNPHGNGTHTECVGHISKEIFTINQCLKKFHFMAELISVEPEDKNGDKVITLNAIAAKLGDKKPEALIIRTIPNVEEKLKKNYSNTNPPFLDASAAQFIHDKNIDHLLIDLPSVDRELDEGKLEAHHIFWQYPSNTKFQRTITEMVFVPDTINDGQYLLNIQIASFENDASPSKPVLYRLQ